MFRFKIFTPNPVFLCLCFLLFAVAYHQNSEAVSVTEFNTAEYLPLIADANIDTARVNPESSSTQKSDSDYHTSLNEPEKITFWQQLIQLYVLPDVKRRSINQEINWLANHPDYLLRVQQRAAPFFPYILEQIEANHMPGELALLPIVESAFQAYAHSPKQAVGIWQFIPETGRRYGLAQNWWYDGRVDIHASTQGAMKYLKKLHKQFDSDWLLAVAAYNCGESKVARLRRHNRRLGKGTDFWSLPLPRETRSYVPRLLAVSRLFADPQRYQIKRLPVSVSKQHRLQTVSINKRMDLAIIANKLGMPLDQLYRLNPGYKRWATGPKRQHTLLLPRDKAELFTTAVKDLSDEELIQIIDYPVADNETLGHIAELYGISSTQIHHFNHLKSTRIQRESTLEVPIPTLMLTDYQEAMNSASTLEEGEQESQEGVRYTVQRRDTVWDIAKMFSVSIQSLTEQNSLKNRKKLYPGQKLIIPTNEPGGNALLHYVVQKGDSLSLIAARFNVKVTHLKRWNASMGRYLRPGQKLVVQRPDSV